MTARFKLPGAFYGRRSDDKQNPRSVEDQQRTADEYAARRGGTIDSDLRFCDDAISARASANRPGLQALYAAMRAGRVGTLIVEDLSRLTRDLADNGMLWRIAQQTGVTIIGVIDGVDTSVEGAIVNFGMRGVMNTAYSIELGKRTRRGLRAQALAGRVCGLLPFGYRSEPADDGLGPRIVIDAEKSPIVVRIFTLFVAGYGYEEIARLLNAEGVASPRRSKKERPGWGHTGVRSILLNPAYAGRGTWGERAFFVDERGKRIARRRDATEIVHVPYPAIITTQTWAAAQERVEKNRGKYAGRPRPVGGRPLKRLFSGLLFCDQCGARMQIQGTKNRPCYVCCEARKRGTCDSRMSVRESEIREKFLDHLADRLVSDAAIAYLRESAARQLSELRAKSGDTAAVHRRTIADLDVKIANVADAIEKRRASHALLARLDDLESARRTAAVALTAAEQAITIVPRLPSVDEIVARAASIVRVLRGNDPRARRVLDLVLPGGIRLSPFPKAGTFLAHAVARPISVLLDAASVPDDPNTDGGVPAPDGGDPVPDVGDTATASRKTSRAGPRNHR